MLRLYGERIYLSVLEKEHCKILWDDFEYDYETMTEPLNIGHHNLKAYEWFEEIQKDQGNKHIRLGIFLNNGTVIGDIALQDISWKERSCFLGIGISRMKYRSKGYGIESGKLLLEHGFNNMGLERISANTLEQNIGAQQCLNKLGFTLEGRERKAVYFAGRKWDRLNYGILREEYNKELEQNISK